MFSDSLFPELTSSAGDSPVSPTASRGGGRAAPMNATCGGSSPELLATLGPDGSWLKMSGDSSVAQTPLLVEAVEDSLAEFSETWPASGSMRSGMSYRLPRLEHLTAATGSSSWPTPTVSGNYNRKGASPTSGDGLATAARLYPTPMASDGERTSLAYGKGNDTLLGRARMRGTPLWPTPCAQDGKNSTLPASQRGRESVPGAVMRRTGQEATGNSPAPSLSPLFVEWLMGFPAEWAALKPSEMP